MAMKNSTWKFGLAFLMMTLGLTASGTSADTVALQTTGGFGLTTSSDQLFGWQFSVNSAIQVNSLGVFDTGGDGLSIAHDVGVYRVSDQALLASMIIPGGAGGALIDGFRFYAMASGLTLTPGEQYVIAMTMPAFNGDDQRYVTDIPTTATEINYINSRFDSGSALAFPAQLGAFAPGIFGPNFLFTNPAAVPEPSSIALGVVPAVMALATARRRSRRIA
jgi:hypothetical protein